jgi:membrane fusion protein, copper/silver efflux system
MRASITVLQKRAPGINVPESAVLHQPDMNLVWIMNAKDTFMPRMVELGTSNNGFVEIESGLKEGEHIVVSGVYLLDSEYRLRKFRRYDRDVPLKQKGAIDINPFNSIFI